MTNELWPRFRDPPVRGRQSVRF